MRKVALLAGLTTVSGLGAQEEVRPPWLDWKVRMAWQPLRLESPRLQDKNPRPLAGATVEVEGWAPWSLEERRLHLKHSLAPAARQAFLVGLGSPYTGQMLAEFMDMGPVIFPATVPSVFYNGTIPYWILMGEEGPYGHSLSRGVRVEANSFSAQSAPQKYAPWGSGIPRR